MSGDVKPEPAYVYFSAQKASSCCDCNFNNSVSGYFVFSVFFPLFCSKPAGAMTMILCVVLNRNAENVVVHCVDCTSNMRVIVQGNVWPIGHSLPTIWPTRKYS